MKQSVFILFLFFSLVSNAQVDSTAIKVSMTQQARDWLFISNGIKHSDEFERLYDSLKLRVHVLTNPNSTVSAKIDSISVGNLLTISKALRSRSFGVSYFVFDRINAGIRAVNNAYLQRQLDLLDGYYIDAYNAVLIDELNRLKRVRQ